MVDYTEACNQIREDHNKIFYSKDFKLKWIWDGIYLVGSSRVPMSIRICKPNIDRKWKEKVV